MLETISPTVEVLKMEYTLAPFFLANAVHHQMIPDCITVNVESGLTLFLFPFFFSFVFFCQSNKADLGHVNEADEFFEH